MDLLMVKQLVQPHDSLRERFCVHVCVHTCVWFTTSLPQFYDSLAPLEPQGDRGTDYHELNNFF